MKIYFSAVVFFAFFSLNVSADAKTVDDYIVFHKGDVKKYKEVMMRGSKNKKESEATDYCLGKYEINGKEIIRLQKKRSTHKNKTYFKYYIINELGFFRYGHFSKGRRIIYDTPACILKNPTEVGQTWENNYRTSDKKPENVKEVREIISVDEVVETPFAVFENCIKIHSRKWRGDTISNSDVWYCPDVGHVKVIIDIPGKNFTVESTLQEVISQ